MGILPSGNHRSISISSFSFAQDISRKTAVYKLYFPKDVFLYIKNKDVKYIADRNPLKYNFFTPGTKIKIF